jgi:hypothetical protein
MCGNVRYAASGPPGGSMICHCRSCRKAAGSPVVAWVTFRPETFAFTRGTPGTFHSSPGVTRTFCASCGTPLTYMHDDRPDDLDVTTCSLDDPEAFPPRHHAWLSHSPAWVRFGDGLPTYE